MPVARSCSRELDHMNQINQRSAIPQTVRIVNHHNASTVRAMGRSEQMNQRTKRTKQTNDTTNMDRTRNKKIVSIPEYICTSYYYQLSLLRFSRRLLTGLISWLPCECGTKAVRDQASRQGSALVSVEDAVVHEIRGRLGMSPGSGGSR